MSVDALQRENASLRAELHRRRASSAQTDAELNVRHREAKSALDELHALRKRHSDAERRRQEDVSAALHQGLEQSRVAMQTLHEKLAASEQRNRNLMKECFMLQLFQLPVRN